MPEGRVLNTGTGGTVNLIQEFIITDQQGNARVSFKNNGSGVAVVTQENSYYGFGLVMPNSPVGTTGTSNKQLYNDGSEWQNDYTSLPDYYQTYYRNYDAALARWVGVDPEAESAESMTTYQYAGNNPIMYNDPLGNLLDPSKMTKPVDPNRTPAMPSFGAPGNGTGGWYADGTGSGESLDQMWANAQVWFAQNLADNTQFWNGFFASGESFADYKTSYDANNGHFMYGIDKSGNILYQTPYYENSFQLETSSGADPSKLDTRSDLTEKQFLELTGMQASDIDANQGGNDIALGITGTSLDAMSKTQSSVGIFTQRMALGYYGNGWGGSQYVNTFKLGKVFGGASTALSVYTTGKSYYDIANGRGTVLTYSDATVGTVGLGAKIISYYSGVEIPFVGEGVAIYGMARTAWDVGNLLRPGITQYEESSKSEGCNICLLPH